MSPEYVPTHSLGQDVRALILRRDVDDLDRSRCNHVPDPVVLDVDMLGALMMDRVLRELVS